MISRNSKVAMGLMLTSGLVSHVAYCETYLTEDAAVKTLLPGGKIEKKSIELSGEQKKKIEKLSGVNVRSSFLNMWIGPKKDVVFIDQVLGKHEFITYATAISNDGKVTGVEIMEYRETYGHQIKGEDWRKQFVGKSSSSALKLKDDIVNISGATLSSSHVTLGIKRLLQTYDVIRSQI